MWAVVLVVILVTYWRLPPDTRLATDDLYHVSGNGVVGGLSRVLIEANFPMAVVGVLLVLVALDALPRRAWIVASPAIALCAVVSWPGVVDQDDLDARWVNIVPALGVALALGLTVTAAGHAGRGLAQPLPLDRVRIGIAVVVLVLSIPWIAADLGFFLPDGIFIMRRVAPDSDGSPIAAVHLGHHHGMDGTLVALSALLLSGRGCVPARPRRSRSPAPRWRSRTGWSTASRTRGTSSSSSAAGSTGRSLPRSTRSSRGSGSGSCCSELSRPSCSGASPPRPLHRLAR